MIKIYIFIFQRLKAALHYTVGRICEKTGKLNPATLNAPFRLRIFLSSLLKLYTFVASNLILIQQASVT